MREEESRSRGSRPAQSKLPRSRPKSSLALRQVQCACALRPAAQRHPARVAATTAAHRISGVTRRLREPAGRLPLPLPARVPGARRRACWRTRCWAACSTARSPPRSTIVRSRRAGSGCPIAGGSCSRSLVARGLTQRPVVHHRRAGSRRPDAARDRPRLAAGARARGAVAAPRSVSGPRSASPPGRSPADATSGRSRDRGERAGRSSRRPAAAATRSPSRAATSGATGAEPRRGAPGAATVKRYVRGGGGRDARDRRHRSPTREITPSPPTSRAPPAARPSRRRAGAAVPPSGRSRAPPGRLVERGRLGRAR